MDRKTVALGIAAAAALGAAVTAALIGGSGSPKHNAVARYIKDVDQVQQLMQAQLTETVKAYRAFASGSTPAGTLGPDLVQAESTLRRLRGRLTALPAPEPATHLRELLLRLISSEVSTAHEIARLAVFAPRYSALLKKAKQDGAELSAALAAVEPPKARKVRGTKKQVQLAQARLAAAASAAAAQQADAVDAYDAKMAAVERGLRRLDAPPVMRPAYRIQIQTIQKSRAAGSALARELRKKDRSRVATLGRRFTIAARTAGSVNAQKAQIAAIKAYNNRVRAIGTLQGDVRQELGRLQQLTG